MQVEARLTWGSDVLGVAHRRVRERMRLSDFGLPFPEDCGFSPIELPRTFVDGRVALHLALVEGDKPLAPAKSDGRVAKGIALGLLLHAAVLAMAYLGRGSDAELERLEALKELVEKEMPKHVVLKLDVPLIPDGDRAPGATGEEGAMGNPASQKTAGVMQRAHGTRRHETDPRPEPTVDSFGIIALLSADGYGKNAGNDPFVAHDGPAAMGSIFGTTIDDAIGVGGMGLSGLGEGGGGKGAGVGLAGVTGTCGPDCFSSNGSQGLGRGIGRLAGTHTARAPVLRCPPADEESRGCSVQVNGRLPPETVQRVVRQNFGRLRGCYEAGLHRNPALEGRVAVKFVIDRAGAVNFASVSERDLPDDDVARCVAMRFQDMTFPQPEGGIVTVVYPLVFASN